MDLLQMNGADLTTRALVMIMVVVVMMTMVKK